VARTAIPSRATDRMDSIWPATYDTDTASTRETMSIARIMGLTTIGWKVNAASQQFTRRRRLEKKNRLRFFCWRRRLAGQKSRRRQLKATAI